MYAEVRQRSADDPKGALAAFRAERDRLFATHPQTPLPAEARPSFRGLAYGDYDACLRFDVEIDTAVPAIRLSLAMSRNEGVAAGRFGRVRLPFGTLDVFWLVGYGGGVFLPFGDRTSGERSYRGGRYLLDTIKGADLGGADGRLVVDFNYAYHPSCFYDPVWSCPLAPATNQLAISIDAGELSAG